MGTHQTGSKPRKDSWGRSTTLDDRNLRGSVKGIMDVGSDSKISQDNNIYTGNLLAVFLNLNTTGLVKSQIVRKWRFTPSSRTNLKNDF